MLVHFALMNPPLSPDATIAFLSPCGYGNLGDAAIIESLIHAVRRRLPRARVVGFTLNPEDTTARHGVEAHTLLGFSRPLYGMREPAAVAATAPNGPATARRRSALEAAARRLLRVPAAGVREALHLRRSLAHLAGASLVVVAGGGQVDATFGGAFGHPYALWRWGRLARRAGARFAFASVGTGTLPSAPARLFARRALALADYRSFRDDRSRELVGDPDLTRNDPIVPDLAYARPVEHARPPGGPRLVVGVSPMAFCHPEHWPRRDVERYRRHAESFGRLAGNLLREGHEVVFFTTDTEPAVVADAVRAVGELPAEARARLRVAPTPTTAALFDVLARVDLVVAARLHGVLLSHVAHRPVLAVSHERKVGTLMEDSGLARYCLPIDAFDPAEGQARLLEVAARRDELRRQVAEVVEANRRRVETQFDLLFGPVGRRDVTAS
jgi:polysaccharide pyruvyl transferase WcaK-like protein